MSDVDRITPYKDGGDVEKRIDEIVALNGQIHIEMMDGSTAWMRIGNKIFWINVDKRNLVIRYGGEE